MTNFAYIIRNDSLIIYIDGKVYNIFEDHPDYNKIVEKIKQKAPVDEIKELCDKKSSIVKYSRGKIEITDDERIMYKGYEIHNSIIDKIFQMKREGFNFEHMILFLENLLQNPSHKTIQELYKFLEKHKMPITEDGHFLAYKKVTNNFKDLYSRSIDNSVGQIVETERSFVDDNSDNLCSNGLHFSSLEYIPKFGPSIETKETKVIVVKVNPKDVVSIPKDHNDAKGRTCRYEVIDVHESENVEKFNNSVEFTFEYKMCYTDKHGENKNNSDSALVMTKNEACEYLNISKDTLRKRIKRGYSVIQTVNPDYVTIYTNRI